MPLAAATRRSQVIEKTWQQVLAQSKPEAEAERQRESETETETETETEAANELVSCPATLQCATCHMPPATPAAAHLVTNFNIYLCVCDQHSTAGNNNY